MAGREIKNLALKIKLTLEYLNTGGLYNIYDVGLLADLQLVKSDAAGNPDPATVSNRVNAFMMAILHSHLSPPFFDLEHISEYQSTLQKDSFYEQQNIDTVEQFEAIFEDLQKGNDFLFRGQREAKWRLYSKAQRMWIIDGLFRHIGYIPFLQKMVSLGREKYLPQIQETLQQFHIDTANDIAVLGYLQHHGCPTPLMDWTFSLPTGVFFAVDGFEAAQSGKEIDQYVSLYYLEKKYFEGGSMRELMGSSLDTVGKEMLDQFIVAIAADEEQLKELQERFSDRSFFDRARVPGSSLVENMTSMEKMGGIPMIYFSDDDQESGIIFSLSNSKNIKTQQGVFIWSADPATPFEMVGAQQYEAGRKPDEPADFRFCKCLNIHKSIVPHIVEKLDAMGIRAETVYPTTAREVNTGGVYEEVKNKLGQKQ
jgi:hypothetical protein